MTHSQDNILDMVRELVNMAAISTHWSYLSNSILEAWEDEIRCTPLIYSGSEVAIHQGVQTSKTAVFPKSICSSLPLIITYEQGFQLYTTASEVCNRNDKLKSQVNHASQLGFHPIHHLPGLRQIKEVQCVQWRRKHDNRVRRCKHFSHITALAADSGVSHSRW
jgi:hypothetical protein